MLCSAMLLYDSYWRGPSPPFLFLTVRSYKPLKCKSSQSGSQSVTHSDEARRGTAHIFQIRLAIPCHTLPTRYDTIRYNSIHIVCAQSMHACFLVFLMLPCLLVLQHSSHSFSSVWSTVRQERCPLLCPDVIRHSDCYLFLQDLGSSRIVLMFHV